MFCFTTFDFCYGQTHFRFMNFVVPQHSFLEIKIPETNFSYFINDVGVAISREWAKQLCHHPYKRARAPLFSWRGKIKRLGKNNGDTYPGMFFLIIFALRLVYIVNARLVILLLISKHKSEAKNPCVTTVIQLTDTIDISILIITDIWFFGTYQCECFIFTKNTLTLCLASNLHV